MIVALITVGMFCKNAKILLMLRNPIKRAISNYKFSVRHGVETRSIEDAFRNESAWLDKYDKSKISVSPYAYLKRGHYINYIEVYDHYVPSEQFRIMLYEETVGHVHAIQQLYQFLGVAHDFAPNTLDQTFNEMTDPLHETISPELSDYLHKHFAESNTCLAKRIQGKLTKWEV